MLRDGQQVRMNLAGMRVGSVVFHAAVTAAVGTIIPAGLGESPHVPGEAPLLFSRCRWGRSAPGSDRCQV